jgi:hypothetical protein
MSEEDSNDAWWHQQELEERQRWEQHRQINREYREWLVTIGVLKRENIANDSKQVPQEG